MTIADQPVLAESGEVGVEARALDVHRRAIVMDSHIDIPLNYVTLENDVGVFTEGQVDLPQMRVGGLDAGFFIVYTTHGPLNEEGYAEGRLMAEAKFAAIDRLTRAYPHQIKFARSSEDVRRLHSQGKLIALIGMENAYPLGEDLSNLDKWARRGIAYMGPMHFGNNQFGDSSNPDLEAGDLVDQNNGLSPLGEKLVARLNELGIMVDVSHASKKAMMKMVELSTAPVIASHSSARAISDHPRNLDDEQLRAIADNGGVAQMVAYDSYLMSPQEERVAFLNAALKELSLQSTRDLAAATEEARTSYQFAVDVANSLWPGATVQTFVDHIDHAVKIAGIDHVGISSDFGGGGGVIGWKTAMETRAVTAELLVRGYTDEAIEKLWGANLLRVMEIVEKIANVIDLGDPTSTSNASSR